MREVNEEIQYYRDHIRRRDDDDNPVNHQMGKLLLDTRKFLVSLYNCDPRKMAFHEIADGDMLPAQVASFAPLRDMHAIRERVTPSAYSQLVAGMRRRPDR